MTDIDKQTDAFAAQATHYSLVTNERINLVPGNVKAGMKAIGTQKDMWSVDLRKTVVKEGLNPRVKDDKYWEKVRQLKESIKKHGWYPDKPLAGYMAKIDGKDVCVIVEGGRRRDAGLMLLSEMDPELADKYKVPVVSKGAGTNELDLQYGLAQGNSNEPFSPFELAALIKRLETVYGQTDADILAGLPGLVSPSTLPKLKMLSAAPLEISARVHAGELSLTEAYNLMTIYGDKAVEVMMQAKAQSEAAGSKKILPKHMPGRKMETLLKKESRPLYYVVCKVKQDPGFANLSEENRAVIEDLLRELQEKEKQFQQQEADAAKALDEANGQKSLIDNEPPADAQQTA